MVATTRSSIRKRERVSSQSAVAAEEQPEPNRTRQPKRSWASRSEDDSSEDDSSEEDSTARSDIVDTLSVPESSTEPKAIASAEKNPRAIFMAKKKPKAIVMAKKKQKTEDSSDDSATKSDNSYSDTSSIPESTTKPKAVVTAKKRCQSGEKGGDPDETLATHLAAAKPFILHSFVSKDGEAMNNSRWDALVGTEWQEDFQICWRAMECGLSASKLEGLKLLKNPDFVSKAFGRAKNKQQAKELWNLIGEDLQRDSKVVFAALDRGVLLFSSLPWKLGALKKKLLAGLKNKLFRWRALPKRHKKDVDFALSVFRSYDDLAAGFAPSFDFKDFANFVEDKERLWAEGACQNPKLTHPGDWAETPTSISSNPKLMLRAISLEAFVANYISSDLAQDREFIETALGRNILALVEFPNITYERLPFVFGMQYIGKYWDLRGNNNLRLRNVVPDRLWSDREFVLGWVSTGCGIHHDIAENLLDDEEIILAHAKNYRKREDRIYHPGAFGAVSKRLRSDKAFLLRVIPLAKAPWDVVRAADGGLDEDYELTVVACGCSCAIPLQRDEFYRSFICRGDIFVSKVKEQLKTFEGFFKGILCGTTQGSGSALTLLDDPNIKRMIATYLDFPFGDLLLYLLEAGRTLHIPGFHPYH